MPKAKRKRPSKPDDQRTLFDCRGFGSPTPSIAAPEAEEEPPEKRPNVRGAAVDGPSTSGEGGAAAPTAVTEGEAVSSPTRSTLSEAGSTTLDGSDDPSSPSMPSFDGNVIDVAANKDRFDKFVAEWKTKTNYAIAVACEALPSHPGRPKCAKKGGTETEVDGILLELDGVKRVIVGVGVCWGEKDAHYISLQKQAGQEKDATDEMIPPPLEDRLHSIKSVLEMGSCTKITKVFDLKTQYKALAVGCDITMNGDFQDPKVAHWLLGPDAKVKRFDEMVQQFTPQESDLLQGLGKCVGVGSLSMTVKNPGSGQTRAAHECVLTFHLMDKLAKLLEEKELSEVFRDVEMPSLVTLARLELNGAGFSSEECERQSQIMQPKLRMLEEEAHQLAGHEFALNSPKAVAQVLFQELKLPDPSSTTNPQPRTHPSTSEDVLEKLKKYHHLPAVILKWRRINKSYSLTKEESPLQKKKVYNPRLKMDRVYGICNLHTATGRVTICKPNLQDIPKEFEIEMPTDTDNGDGSPSTGEETMSKRKVCMRHAFIPFKGGVILEAYYSQLEKRIMAHLSKDDDLNQALNSGQDVVKAFASRWEGVSDEQAKELFRNSMIYGKVPKSVGEQLGVDEEEVARFVKTFKYTYRGMEQYRHTTVTQCRRNGYVQTITGRRRYLPGISKEDDYFDKYMHGDYISSDNWHAEMQVLNTEIEGSAADLVKKAMVSIDKKLQEEFPATKRSHRHGESTAAADTQNSRSQQLYSPPRGAYLILQDRGKLIYEVHKEDEQRVTEIVKHEMENAMKLSIELPVKVKVGSTWGSVQ